MSNLSDEIRNTILITEDGNEIIFPIQITWANRVEMLEASLWWYQVCSPLQLDYIPENVVEQYRKNRRK